jgi:RimJ/RimL family protein N-acetyltransferase
VITFDASLVSPWISEKAGGSGEASSAIGLMRNNRLIAGASYSGFTGGNVWIGTRIDFNPHGLFYGLAFDYPFNQLKVNRLSGIVRTNNSKAIRLNEHLGFKREALLRDYFLDSDAIVYVMYKDDCKFLRGQYRDKVKEFKQV